MDGFSDGKLYGRPCGRYRGRTGAVTGAVTGLAGRPTLTRVNGTRLNLILSWFHGLYTEGTTEHRDGLIRKNIFSELKKKYPECAAQIDEYLDGLTVEWSKLENDSAEKEKELFNQHKNEILEKSAADLEL